jgi:hypothetical protein
MPCSYALCPPAFTGAKGVPLIAEGGDSMTVQLLSDDLGTWIPWILDKDVNPMQPVATKWAPLLSTDTTGSTATSSTKEL